MVGLNLVYQNMARFLHRTRQILAASVLLLLAGVVVLSMATRRPCVQAQGASWHTIKAGRMLPPEGLEACKIPRTLAVYASPLIPRESPAIPSIYAPHEELALPGLSIVFQIRNFRAPPLLG